MRQLGVLSMIVCVAAATGCNICCWGKRASELGSPTDIRKAHFWCLGEDAIFEQPCGPSKDDYGLKTTCWREWPADGGRCKPGTCPPSASCGPNGHCAPLALPLEAPQLAVPPVWEGSTPNEAIPIQSPFRDDEPTLPAPTNSHELPGSAHKAPQPAESRESLLGPSLGTPPVTKTRLKELHPQRRAESANKTAPPTITVSPVATTPPVLLGTAKAKPIRPNTSQSLKIAVSPQIDTPVRTLPQIVPPNDVSMPKVSQPDTPRLEAETLSAFDQMFEAPAALQPKESRPLVVHNDYAPDSKPFRLATRSSLVETANDPALKKETLSALESMISDDGTPGAGQ